MKFSKLLFLMSAATLLAGCGEPKPGTFTKVEDNEILIVGDNHRFRNNTTSLSSDQVIEVPVGSITYTLVRSTYNYDSYTCYYDGYYYGLTHSTISKKTINLGKKTVNTTVTYAYMPYGRDNNWVVVETTTKVKTTYSYEGHWEYFDAEIVLDLNGYFESEIDFKDKLPTLANEVEEMREGKVYCDAVNRELVSRVTDDYDDYYYIEETKN